MDTLVWSDDEDDNDPRRYIPQYPKPKRLSREIEAVHDERLRSYRSASDTSAIINGGVGKLTDHKRSIFSGNVKTTAKEVLHEDKEIKRLHRLASTKQLTSDGWEKVTHPDILHHIGKTLIKQLWQQTLSTKALDIETSLIAVNLLPQIVQWIAQQPHVHTAHLTQLSSYLTQNYEKDDYLSFTTLLEVIIQFEVFPPMQHEVDFKTSNTQALKLQNCCCGQISCSHCNSTAIGILHSELLQTLIKAVDEKEDEEERQLTRGEIFRLKVAYGQQQVAHPHNRLYGRDVRKIMQTAGLKADETRLFRDGWSACQHLMLPSFDITLTLAQALVLRNETVHLSKQLEKLLVYRLPRWLQSEFPTAEILLYQHHFRLIDKDGGGSIDAEELRALLANFSGRNVPLSEAEGILQAYDTDGGGTLDFTEFLVLIYRMQRGTVEQAGGDLLEALLEAKRQLGLFEQIQNTAEQPPDCITIRSFGGNPILVEVTITLPPDDVHSCALRGLTMAVEVLLKDGFPYRCPDVRFPQPIIAPHFLRGADGSCRCPHLSTIWGADWSLSSLLEHVVELLIKPSDERLWAMLPQTWQDIYSSWKRKLIWLRTAEAEDEEEDAEEEIIFSETELVNIDNDKIVETDNSKPIVASVATKKQRRLYSMQELSNESNMAVINKLTRLEIYHMQTLLLYLQDGEDSEGNLDGAYAKYARTLTACISLDEKAQEQ